MDLIVEENKINRAHSVKYLELYLDRNVKGFYHIRAATTKANITKWYWPPIEIGYCWVEYSK